MAQGRPILPVLLAFVLCSCATTTIRPTASPAALDAEARLQMVMAERDFLLKLEKVDRVAWSLMEANTELCGSQLTWKLGFSFADASDYPRNRAIFEEAYGMKLSKLVLLQVTPNGPAAQAGAQKGDIILKVEGQHVENKKDAFEILNKRGRPQDPVTLGIERNGSVFDITVPSVQLCDYPVTLQLSSAVNAYANGRGITIFTGMVKFTRTDDELAAILGHEMAHNIMGHRKAKQGNALLGILLFDLPAAIFTGSNPRIGEQVGAQAFSQDFESEADYVGLYLTARAGYDIQNVADIWRRMAIENPGAITLGNTHPSTSARFVNLEADRDEIYAKMKAHQELVPNIKRKDHK